MHRSTFKGCYETASKKRKNADSLHALPLCLCSTRPIVPTIFFFVFVFFFFFAGLVFTMSMGMDSRCEVQLMIFMLNIVELC